MIARAKIPALISDMAALFRFRGRLRPKFVAVFTTVVCVALLSNAMFEVLFSYKDRKASLIRIQHEQAEAAASQIAEFMQNIEEQLAWTTHEPWTTSTPDRQSLSLWRMVLRQVPADHRSRADRQRRTRTAAGVAAEPGRHRQRARFFQGSQIFRGGDRQAVPQPGVFSRRLGTLHDDLAAGAQWERERGRGQPQIHLGRRLPDQGRRAWAGLCGRRAGPPDRASRHQPGAAQHGPFQSRPGAGRAHRIRRGRRSRPRSPRIPTAGRC